MEKIIPHIRWFIAIASEAVAVWGFAMDIGNSIHVIGEFFQLIFVFLIVFSGCWLSVLLWNYVQSFRPTVRFKSFESEIDYIISKGGDFLSAMDDEKGDILDARRMKLRMDLVKLNVHLPEDRHKWKIKELSAFAHVGNLEAARKLHKPKPRRTN